MTTTTRYGATHLNSTDPIASIPAVVNDAMDRFDAAVKQNELITGNIPDFIAAVTALVQQMDIWG